MVMRKKRIYPPLQERLYAKLAVKGEDDCWEWNGWRHPQGHGQIGLNGTLIYTHRAAWQIAYGPIPEGMYVCHKCDNPPCCNPKHLFLGTAKDNVQDMLTKRRHSHGDRHASKLSTERVVAIKALLAEGKTQQSVADEFNISRSMVGFIGRGQRWRYL